ncbi:MAG: NAD(P)-dependent oxidoreductase [Rickettsiales bacterium]|nr:NAD(P)-dependent oxidoreductase [Rickettsiales bacterium]
MSKKFLVTGVTGYVGSKLAKKLISENYEVIAIKRPSSSLKNILEIQDKITLYDYDGTINSIEKIFTENKNISAVFHIASWYLRDHKPENINDLISSNIIFSNNLIEAATNNNCLKFVNTTSFTEFGLDGNYNPDSLYSSTKKAFREILEYYTKCRNISAITLVLYDNYGVDDNRKKLFWLLDDAYKNNRKIDFTEGLQKLSPVYIDDAINGYLKAFELLDDKDFQNKNLLYFLASEVFSLREIVEKYIKITGKEVSINWGAIDYRNNQIMTPYIGEILPNWKPKILLEEGLKLL